MISNLNLFQTSHTLIFLLALNFSQGGNIANIRFWEHHNFQGHALSVGLRANSSSCFNFPHEWNDRVSSLDTENECIVIWEHGQCGGRSAPITSSQNSLAALNFDDTISSFRMCSAGTDSGSNSGDSNDIRRASLDEHNSRRRRHGSPGLSWDRQLESVAQKHCDYLATTSQFHHSGNGYGENLAANGEQNKAMAVRKALTQWYEGEIENYNYDDPDKSKGTTGHFTQVVWRNSRSLGVGVSWDATRNWWIVCANYNPPGNFGGQHKENVLRPRS